MFYVFPVLHLFTIFLGGRGGGGGGGVGGLGIWSSGSWELKGPRTKREFFQQGPYNQFTAGSIRETSRYVKYLQSVYGTYNVMTTWNAISKASEL